MNCTEFSGLNDPTIWAGIGFTFLFVLFAGQYCS